MTLAARNRLQSYPLRIPASTRQKANDLAHREGISLNHFISIAIAEKISRNEQALVSLAKPRQVAPALPRLTMTPLPAWRPRKLT